jgi:hypothetical protein
MGWANWYKMPRVPDCHGECKDDKVSQQRAASLMGAKDRWFSTLSIFMGKRAPVSIALTSSLPVTITTSIPFTVVGDYGITASYSGDLLSAPSGSSAELEVSDPGTPPVAPAPANGASTFSSGGGGSVGSFELSMILAWIVLKSRAKKTPSNAECRVSSNGSV